MSDGTENNLSCSFLLWRGARMKDEWIKDYEANKGECIKFKGISSTSRSLGVAMSFAFSENPNAEPDGRIPVIFSISCSNYKGILGLTIRSEACTCYPNENETVFIDGATVNIWTVERDHLIENT